LSQPSQKSLIALSSLKFPSLPKLLSLYYPKKNATNFKKISLLPPRSLSFPSLTNLLSLYYHKIKKIAPTYSKFNPTTTPSPKISFSAQPPLSILPSKKKKKKKMLYSTQNHPSSTPSPNIFLLCPTASSPYYTKIKTNKQKIASPYSKSPFLYHIH